MNKIPPNPNAIIAALLDVASAAYALNHGAHHTGKMLDEVNTDDLDALNTKLAVLENLPQMAENESFTGPRRAAGWLASFLVGEVALNIEPEKLKELQTTLAQMRSAPLTIAEFKPAPPAPGSISAALQEFLYRTASQVPFEHATWANERGAELLRQVKALEQQGSFEGMTRQFENDMRAYQDADLLSKVRMMCGYVENGSEQTVSFYQDDATRDWTLRVGTDNVILKTKARRYHSSSFHQVIRVAAEKEIPEEDEPEECKFCGITTTSPCEAPPTGPCEQANNTIHGDPTK